MYRLLVILIVSQFSESARILGMIPTPSYSHQVVYRALWKELARKGHEVIVITADPEDEPNSKFRQIDISFSYSYAKLMVEMLTTYENSHILMAGPLKHFLLTTTAAELSHPEVEALLGNNTEHFDLVLTEFWWDLTYGLAKRFNCPLIVLSTQDVDSMRYGLFGQTTHPIAYPNIALGLEASDMTFWDRLHTVFHDPLFRAIEIVNRDIVSAEKHLWKKCFGGEMPNRSDLMRMVSMIFVNKLPTLYHRPVGPAVVPIGGNIHLKPAKDPSPDLAEYLDGAKKGVIYVSLGTNVKGDFIPNQVREAFIGAFAELPYKILWKLDIKLSNVPNNVKIVDWVPQQDVLRHPSIKAFVFQGGLQSMDEAIANKIPLVGIPFISDQDTNVKKLVKNGFGIGLNKDTITKENLKGAILELINNPKYKQAISKMAEIIADQPMTGLEKAVWWTEYVIRHKGAPHLRNPIMDLPFYQYYLLDVIGFCFVVTIIMLYVIYTFLSIIKKMLLKLLTTEKQTKVKVK